MQKTALITGSAMRIGRSMAEHLAGTGWNIAVHYNRSSDTAEQLAKLLAERYPGQSFEIFKADLMSDVETENLLPSVIEKMGCPWLLINNASVFEPRSLKDTPTRFFDEQMTVNFRAPFILSRDFSRLCKEGLIINFTDTRITSNKSNFAAYTLAKKALWELTKMAANEWGPQIRVNAISPGLTLAPAEKGEDYLWSLAQNIPMKRPGGIDPILNALDYILQNDYLTGQMLFCDGGENLGPSH
jgi:pteridine reductase